MNNPDKKWHSIHARGLRKREATHEERLRRRKLDIEIQRGKSANRIHMKVPKLLDFYKNYDESIKFINDINQHIFENDAFVFLDFSQCEGISAEACVVLAAEIDRCNRLEEGSVFGVYPKNPDVYFLLNELGFYHLLGIRSSKPTFDDAPEVDVVKLQSGQDNPRNLMVGIKELFYGDEEDEQEILYSKKVYRALTEGMANAVEHAYPEKFLKENSGLCLPRWWRAGFKDNETNTVFMVLYDQGAGIPNTLTTNWLEKLNALASRLARDPFDDEKIVLAMEKGRTTTKVQGRGQGSYDMQQLIRESENAELSIFSYRGKYMYPDDGNWKHENLNSSLRGTLVVWKVCLNSVKEKINEN